MAAAASVLHGGRPAEGASAREATARIVNTIPDQMVKEAHAALTTDTEVT
jgi:hypothetical protein